MLANIRAACAGFVFGLSIADQFITTGQMRHVLVIGVELLSRVVDWTEVAALFARTRLAEGHGAIYGTSHIAPDEARRLIEHALPAA